jgi:hypothetical protein
MKSASTHTHIGISRAALDHVGSAGDKRARLPILFSFHPTLALIYFVCARIIGSPTTPPAP